MLAANLIVCELDIHLAVIMGLESSRSSRVMNDPGERLINIKQTVELVNCRINTIEPLL